MRWYRRCILLSAFDRRALEDPFELGGGSFTGPFEYHHALEAGLLNERSDFSAYRWDAFNAMRSVYLDHVDELPHHFQLHFMHGAQIVGVHHPIEATKFWWRQFYCMIVNDAHLHPESDDEMNTRLSDNRKEWMKREVVTAK